MARRIRLYGIERRSHADAGTALESEMVDLVNPPAFRRLVLAFGTGYYQEARAVGEDSEAMELFRGLMIGGGYRPGPPPAVGLSWLYRDGDVAFPQEQPFV